MDLFALVEFGNRMVSPDTGTHTCKRTKHEYIRGDTIFFWRYDDLWVAGLVIRTLNGWIVIKTPDGALDNILYLRKPNGVIKRASCDDGENGLTREKPSHD